MAIQTSAGDIHLRSSQPMGLNARTPFSVSAWINAVWNPGTVTSMVGIYGGSNDVGLEPPVTAMQIGCQAGNGDITCWTWGGGALVTVGGGTMTPFNNTWVFIVYTYDGTTHRVYRNGTLLGTGTTTQQAGFLNQVYINGYPSSGTNEVANFQTDQYSLFRRTLSADEVQSMFTARGSRHGITDGLIARYDFDEQAQDTIVSSIPDLSGNNHTLTLVGTSQMSYAYTNTNANSNLRLVH